MAAALRRTALLPRILALAVFAASVLGIVKVTRQSVPVAADLAAAGGDCVARKRAEIDQEKAAGRLTAEQAMIRRQKIKAECG